MKKPFLEKFSEQKWEPLGFPIKFRVVKLDFLVGEKEKKNEIHDFLNACVCRCVSFSVLKFGAPFFSTKLEQRVFEFFNEKIELNFCVLQNDPFLIELQKSSLFIFI